jgi:hypothetical protein
LRKADYVFAFAMADTVLVRACGGIRLVPSFTIRMERDRKVEAEEQMRLGECEIVRRSTRKDINKCNINSVVLFCRRSLYPSSLFIDRSINRISVFFLS